MKGELRDLGRRTGFSVGSSAIVSLVVSTVVGGLGTPPRYGIVIRLNYVFVIVLLAVLPSRLVLLIEPAMSGLKTVRAILDVSAIAGLLGVSTFGGTRSRNTPSLVGSLAVVIYGLLRLLVADAGAKGLSIATVNEVPVVRRKRVIIEAVVGVVVVVVAGLFIGWVYDALSNDTTPLRVIMRSGVAIATCVVLLGILPRWVGRLHSRSELQRGIGSIPDVRNDDTPIIGEVRGLIRVTSIAVVDVLPCTSFLRLMTLAYAGTISAFGLLFYFSQLCELCPSRRRNV